MVSIDHRCCALGSPRQSLTTGLLQFSRGGSGSGDREKGGRFETLFSMIGAYRVGFGWLMNRKARRCKRRSASEGTLYYREASGLVRDRWYGLVTGQRNRSCKERSASNGTIHIASGQRRDRWYGLVTAQRIRSCKNRSASNGTID